MEVTPSKSTYRFCLAPKGLLNRSQLPGSRVIGNYDERAISWRVVGISDKCPDNKRKVAQRLPIEILSDIHRIQKATPALLRRTRPGVSHVS
jgi:hypothetical protein